MAGFTACSQDLTEEQKKNTKENPKHLTEFFATNSAKTRTGAKYVTIPSGLDGLLFYWNSGDQIWIDKNNDGVYVKNDGSDIQSGSKLEDANFFFNDQLNATSYKVRYTGNNSSAANEVTFAETQIQTAPNDASNIGKYGDCGVAVATKTAQGKYQFTLQHKAAYMVLSPYSTYGFSSSVGVVAVYVTASKPISGKFAFDDNGVGEAKTGAKNTIAWFYKQELLGRKHISSFNSNFRDQQNMLPLPTAADVTRNGIIITMPAGTYEDLTIEYGLVDNATGGYGYYKQTFKNKTLVAGENRVLSRDIKLDTEFDPNEYYAWDAVQDEYYWKGATNKLRVGRNMPSESTGYATSSADPRFQNEIPGGSTSNVEDNAATRGATVAFNHNEALWLILNGEAKWDEWKMYVMNKHLYNGGIWIKTLKQIALERRVTVESLKEGFLGMDFRACPCTNNPHAKRTFNDAAENYERPAKADRSKYMFMPAAGYFGRPTLASQQNLRLMLFCGDQGFYWTSNAGVTDNKGAMAFTFQRNDVSPFVDNDHSRYDADEASPSFTISLVNFDKYTGAPYLVDFSQTGKFRLR
jgi:lipoprotein